MVNLKTKLGGERALSRHILPTSATMIGICTTFIGLVKVAESKMGDLPPLKWSSLKYIFRMEDEIDGKEEAYG